ncbi:MAG: hypothetical protein JNN15_12010 [Blastocatellia bacterium]|nr:hypothetical protein [Blastocatellia bacterium]
MRVMVSALSTFIAAILITFSTFSFSPAFDIYVDEQYVSTTEKLSFTDYRTVQTKTEDSLQSSRTRNRRLTTAPVQDYSPSLLPKPLYTNVLQISNSTEYFQVEIFQEVFNSVLTPRSPPSL